MSQEIERKFLVDPAWKPASAGTAFRQGYLNSAKERVVRVRLAGNAAKLTIKGKTIGVTRAEFEYDIPTADAEALLALCEQPIIEKRRHLEEFGGHTFEVDVFAGANAGLIIAELELTSEDEAFSKPPWLRDEVSDDPRYYNNNLMLKPYSTW
ncbi:MAG: CYTH domain-containing protein [Deltaproteobacteria bacterium]|nr:CYTH domain-containing protein [Deltaproteobacteria bacterium]